MMLLPLLLFTPVLLYVAQSDLRWMRIPNTASLLGIGLFVVTIPLIGLEEAISRILPALIVFCIGFALFLLRIFAGGDVKILAVLMLFIPSGTLSLFALVFSGAMLLGIVAVTATRALALPQLRGWVSMRARGMMPMGLSISLAGIGHLAVLYALQTSSLMP
ncbi:MULTISPECIES: A24 family peptidase [Falsihalocynthiibacter]|uniref:A24 family peptidase n=1 Tax=Falsihalocynthiibacter TaxID=2854182 RepID=UPI0030027867